MHDQYLMQKEILAAVICKPYVPPHPLTYGDGRCIEGLMCGTVTFRVPPQCQACDMTQIPSGIYYFKEQGYDSAGPRSEGLWWMKSRPLYSP